MADVSSILLDRVADWLTQSSLAGIDLELVVRGLCERLAAAGLPVKRVHLSFSMLHPLYDALGFTWERGGGMSVERFRTKPGERPERFLRSPYYHLISNNLDHLRRRIDKSVPSEFPVLDELKELGMTDYLAFYSQFRVDDVRAGHDGLVDHRSCPVASSTTYRGVAQDPEPSGGGRQDGGAEAAGR